MFHFIFQVKPSSLKYYYMEDDGGSFFSSPVHPEIRASVQKVIIVLTVKSFMDAAFSSLTQSKNFIIYVLLQHVELTFH